VGALPAQRVLDLTALRLAPALAIALLVGRRTGMDTPAVAAFLATFASAQAVAHPRYPMHLLPIAGPLLRAAPAAIGAAVGSLTCYLLVGSFMFDSLVLAVPAAWLLLALGFWIKHRFDTDRQIRVAVVGSSSVAATLTAELQETRLRGYEVAGWISVAGPVAASEADWAPEPTEGEPASSPPLGTLADVRDVVCTHGIDLLVNGPAPGTDNGSRLHVYETVAAACLDLPVRMIDGVQLYEELLGHVPLGTTDAAWFQYLMHPRYRTSSGITKRAIDIVVGGVATVVTLPIVLAAALAVQISDGGPPFLRQRRVGEAGREFTMLKLRSMRVDAEPDGEARLAEEADERVTGIGRFLRRTHIDELPQLWNVLRGEMSLVGPRPERPPLVSDLERQFRYYDRRHLVKPGITGWAQVRCGYAGSDIGVAWKLCHDLYYLKHRSALTDLAIMAETVRAAVADAQYGLRAPDERFIVGQSAAGVAS
jgi:exopolysaccharide biosynthesis polyprenyl glycosylphosphotransferase